MVMVLFSVLGYTIYFKSNPVNKFIHVLVGRGKQSENDTEIGITSTGSAFVSSNNLGICSSDISKLLRFIRINSIAIQEHWVRSFGDIEFFC